jgi:pimeloyl-ACP methyl ester carboxylesterase
MQSDSFCVALEGLTESTSRNLAAAVQRVSVETAFCKDAISTTFVQQGQGDPVLLLHGFDSSVLEFRRLLPLLAARQQAWAVDLLGFGFTERPDDLEITTNAVREHLYQFWQKTIQTPVVLVGASMGGAAAIDFTLAFPEAVDRLVLIDSAGYRSGPALGKLLIQPLGYWATERFLRRPSIRQKISEKAYFDPSFASSDAQRCAALHLDSVNWSRALISFTRSGGYRSIKSRLAQIQVQTLILWGDSDQILGTKDAELLHRGIPQSQLIWVPECGHVPHLEKPEFTAEAILKFIG